MLLRMTGRGLHLNEVGHLAPSFGQRAGEEVAEEVPAPASPSGAFTHASTNIKKGEVLFGSSTPWTVTHHSVSRHSIVDVGQS
jgi:hypothetical protein